MEPQGPEQILPPSSGLPGVGESLLQMGESHPTEAHQRMHGAAEVSGYLAMNADPDALSGANTAMNDAELRLAEALGDTPAGPSQENSLTDLIREMRLQRARNHRGEVDTSAPRGIRLSNEFMQAVNNYPAEQLVVDITSGRRLLEELKAKMLAAELASTVAEVDIAVLRKDVAKMAADLRDLENIYSYRQQIESARRQSRQEQEYYAARRDESKPGDSESAVKRTKRKLRQANTLGVHDPGALKTSDRDLREQARLGDQGAIRALDWRAHTRLRFESSATRKQKKNARKRKKTAEMYQV